MSVPTVVDWDRIEAVAIDYVGAIDGSAEPGFAISIQIAGRTAWRLCRGFADQAFPAAIDEHTRFRIASISKQFAAAMVILLVRDGLLSLDMSVAEVLPELRRLGSAIRLRHLLSMSSGLHEHSDLLMLSSGSSSARPGSVADWRRMVALQPTLSFEPGTDFSYNNSNYLLVEWIIERSTGATLSALLDERIFRRTGMNDTLLPLDSQRACKGLATGYARSATGFDVMAPWHTPGAAGGILSTLHDLETWQNTLRSDPVFGGHLDDQLAVPSVFSTGATSHYGFGIERRLHAGRRWTGHAGGVPGFGADIVHFSDDDVAVIVLANRDDIRVQRLSRLLADHVIEGRSVMDLAKPTLLRRPTGSEINVYSNRHAGRVVSVDESGALSTANALPLETMEVGAMRTLVGDPAEYSFVDGHRHVMRETRVNGETIELLRSRVRRTDPAEATELVGRYQCEWLGADWDMAIREEHLVFQQHSPWRHAGALQVLQADVDLYVLFEEPGLPSFGQVVRAERSSDGSIAGLTLFLERTRGLFMKRLSTP